MFHTVVAEADERQIGIIYVIVTTVLFVFPPDLPVTGSNMNYCIVAFAIVIIIATFQWFIDGRKNFHGPLVNLNALKEGGVLAIDPVATETEDLMRKKDDDEQEARI
jgi:choline transport protein